MKCSFEGDSIRLPLTKDTTLIEFLAWVEKKWGVGKGIEYLTDRKWMKMEKNDELRKMYEQANLGKEVHFQIYSEGATRGENDHALVCGSFFSVFFFIEIISGSHFLS